MLPKIYEKEKQPFEHFETAEELARYRVKEDIKTGWANHDQAHAGNGWYGHHTEIKHDKLIVLECGGKEMYEVFNYKQLVIEERQKQNQKTLFD